MEIENTQSIQQFMWFNLKPTSLDEDREELPLLLKVITTIELPNANIPITPKKKFTL